MLLSKIYPLLALIPTAFCGVSLGQESPWKLFFLLLIYPGFTLALFALHFIVAYFWSLILKRFPEPETPKKIYSYMTVATEDILCRFAGAKLEGFDPSALPGGPFLLVSNHLSNFDPIVTSVWLSKRKSVFISKESNFRLPIAGSFIRQAGYLCIDRSDPMKAMAAVSCAVKRLNQGFFVGVYPEGTRSKTGKLGEFRDGIFLIAKKAAVPVVVVTLSGTEKIHKNFFRRRTSVKLTLSGIIDKETVATSRTGTHSQIAQEMIGKTQKSEPHIHHFS